MQSTKDAKAPVLRAREIAAGATPSVEDVLSLTALLERVARSLDRLEGSAKVAASDGLYASLAALSGQLHRGVETAAKLQGLYSETPAQQEGRFSVQIVIPQIDAKPPVTIDCTPERGSKASDDPVPQITARRNVAYHFDLGEDGGD